jgi:hypothetical protein
MPVVSVRHCGDQVPIFIIGIYGQNLIWSFIYFVIVEPLWLIGRVVE